MPSPCACGSGSGGPVYDPVDYGSAQLAAEDGVLLPLMAKLDRGRGVSSYDLYGHGVPRGLVDEWVPDALVRGLVEFDLDHRSLVLTPKGKRKAKS